MVTECNGNRLNPKITHDLHFKMDSQWPSVTAASIKDSFNPLHDSSLQIASISRFKTNANENDKEQKYVAVLTN